MTECIHESIDWKAYPPQCRDCYKSFNGENIGGLCLVESLHEVANRLNRFVLSCDLIEDVFGTDDEIVTFLVSKIRLFSVKKN